MADVIATIRGFHGYPHDPHAPAYMRARTFCELVTLNDVLEWADGFADVFEVTIQRDDATLDGESEPDGRSQAPEGT